MRARTISTTLVAGMAALTLAACSSADAGGDGDDSADSYNVVFSFGQSVHPFFIAMEKGARDYAEESGHIDFSVTSADYEVETQVDDVENSLLKDTDGVLLNPIDSAALANVVNSANQEGIPVITVDIDVVGADAASFVASDNKEIGRQAAQYIAEQIGGSGKVALIGAPQVTSTNQREEGFLEELANHPDIELVANSGEAMQRDAALSAAETILEANPDLDAVYGVNESGALGAMGAVQARGLDVVIVGVDATPDMLDAIEGDTPVRATIAQDPYQMGYKAMELMDSRLQGEDIPQTESAPIDLVTEDNVQEFIDREAQYAE